MTGLQADGDAAGLITWEVSVDSTIARAHQHAAGARTRPQDLKELPGGVVDELAVHLRAPGRPTDDVFRAPAGGPLRINRFRYRMWLPAVMAAGLRGLRIHDLRHTAVALWIAAGASPKEVAARAGHTSVSFVLDRYGHLFPESDAALRDRLDLLFRGATEQHTEHGRLRHGQGTLSLSRCRCPELVLYPRGRDRFRTCGLCRVKSRTAR
jgi:hypothetical protein